MRLKANISYWDVTNSINKHLKRTGNSGKHIKLIKRYIPLNKNNNFTDGCNIIVEFTDGSLGETNDKHIIWATNQGVII